MSVPWLDLAYESPYRALLYIYRLRTDPEGGLGDRFGSIVTALRIMLVMFELTCAAYHITTSKRYLLFTFVLHLIVHQLCYSPTVNPHPSQPPPANLSPAGMSPSSKRPSASP